MSSVMDICSQFHWQEPDILTFAGEAIDPQVLENNLLTDWIYRRFHAKASRLDIAIRLDWNLFTELQEATPYDTVQETGWERVRDEPQGTVLSKDGIELLVPNSSANNKDRLGESFSIFLPAWRPHLSPGFFALCGPRPLGHTSLSRIYFSGSRKIGPHIVSLVSGWNIATQLPWSLKVFGELTSTQRTDAAVLYVPRRELPTFLDALSSSPNLDILSPEISDFTCPVSPGIAWAHDTGTKESFGEWASRIIAEAVLAGRTSTSITSEIIQSVNFRISEPWLCATPIEE